MVSDEEEGLQVQMEELRREMSDLRRRVGSIESWRDDVKGMAQQVGEIYVALIGDLNKPGGYERRISDCEADIEALEARIKIAEMQLEKINQTVSDWRAQLRLVAIIVSLLGVGNIIAALLYLFG